MTFLFTEYPTARPDLHNRLSTLALAHSADPVVHCSDKQPAPVPAAVDPVVVKTKFVLAATVAAAVFASSATTASARLAPLLHSVRHKGPYQSVVE